MPRGADMTLLSPDNPDETRERIREMAQLMRQRAEEKDRPLDEQVYWYTHDGYFLSHDISDITLEKQNLYSAYGGEFYDAGEGTGSAHVKTRMEQAPELNHVVDREAYSYAAALEWILCDTLGIDPVEEEPEVVLE